MKKTLALILMLVLVAFAFASCGKDGNSDATTAKPTAAAGTTAAAPTEPDVEPEPTGHVHDAQGTDYVVTTPPTCISDGVETLYCYECGDPMDTRPVAKDPKAHTVTDWTTTKVASIIGDGSRTGVCTLCHENVVETVKDETILEWKYTTMPTSQKKKHATPHNLLDNGEHYYSDPDQGTEGLSLIIEYSFLYNPTLHNLADKTDSNGGRPIVIGSMYDADIYWVPLKDNALYCNSPFAGGFERADTLRTVEFGPEGMGDQIGVGTGKNYSDFPNIGGADQANPEYGWHRLAFFYHQELLNPAEVKAGEEAKYLISSTGYLDGDEIFMISNRASEKFEPSSAFTNDGVLFTAVSDGNGGIIYTDCPNKRNVTWAKIQVTCTSQDVAYAVLADNYVTAGTEVVQKVERVNNPAANTYTTEDGVEINAPIWYRIVAD